MSVATNSLASTTAVPGSQASSPMTSSTGRPSTPPASLASLTASCAASRISRPEWALVPDSGIRAPSRIGAGAAAGGVGIREAQGRQRRDLPRRRLPPEDR